MTSLVMKGMLLLGILSLGVRAGPFRVQKDPATFSDNKAEPGSSTANDNRVDERDNPTDGQTGGDANDDDDDNSEFDDEDDFEFPPNLNLNFVIQRQTISLSLTFLHPMYLDIPTIEIHGNGDGEEVEEEEEIDDDTMHYAVYTEDNTEKPFIVACGQTNAPDTCTLDSPLRVGNDTWDMNDPEGPRMLKKTFIKSKMDQFGLFNSVWPQPSNGTEGFNPRAKRQSSGITHTVEVTILADETIYNFFRGVMGYSSRKSRSNLRAFTRYLIKDVDAHFLSFYETDKSINIRCVVRKVFYYTGTNSPWKASSKKTLQGVTYLDNDDARADLKAWRKARIAKIKGDHVAAITFYDVAMINSDGTVTEKTSVGSAYKCSACDKVSDISVNELVANRGSTIIAHELGHSLCSDHDGPPTNENCPISDMHTMASFFQFSTDDVTQSANQWRFSSCSQTMIKSFVTSDERQCLRMFATRTSTRRKQFTSSLSGSVYDLDMQCIFLHGPGASACVSDNTVDPLECHIGMTCNTGSGCFGTFVPTPVLPGSSCGPGKHCFRGRCENKPPKCTKKCKKKNRNTYCTGTACCFYSWGKNTSCCKDCCKTDKFVDCP